MTGDEILKWLDEDTDWDEDGGVLAGNDPPPDDEDSDGAVALMDEEDSMDEDETLPNIMSCVSDMYTNGRVEDILVVINTVDDDQLLFTTIDRNDLILGCLETAKMNWHATQAALQGEQEEGGEE
jgi:hypothetical protein